jgi:hypothetical protein
MPTIKQYRDVMIPVEKNEWLLMNHNEESIKQFTAKQDKEV